VFKETGRLPTNWLYLSIPLILALIVVAYYLFQIVVNFFRSVYLLTPAQSFCLIGYVFSFLLASIGVLLTIEDSVFYMNYAYFFWTVAVSLVSLCGTVTLFHEGIRLAESRGYTNPRKLSRTDRGWDIIEKDQHQLNPFLMLLGEVKRERISLKQLSQRDKFDESKIVKVRRNREHHQNSVNSYSEGKEIESYQNENQLLLKNLGLSNTSSPKTKSVRGEVELKYFR
jgi:hypothetical protein